MLPFVCSPLTKGILVTDSFCSSRLLDLLLDVNNSGQIPPEKRIDLSIDLPSDDDALFLDIDRPSTPPRGPTPAKSYKQLLHEVPHFRFSSAAERFPELLADLEARRDSPADPAQGQSHPPSFLTADDIDNYIWELDAHLANEDAATGTGKTDAVPLPTLAPLAHADRPNPKDSQRDFAVRNPTSVYNWLRKHAPKTFLQDAEHDKDGGGGKESGGGGDDHGHGLGGGSGHGHGPGSGRRGKGERAPRGSGVSRSKRASAAHIRASAAAEGLEDMDDEPGFGGGGGAGSGGGAMTPSTVVAGGGKGKRKRVMDDDPGYRPKGGSSRPTKKKRKSEGAERTPTAKGPRKSEGAGWAGNSAASEKGSSTKGPRKSEGAAAYSGRQDDD